MPLSSASFVSRRRFLRLAAQSVAGGLSLTALAGCGGGGGKSGGTTSRTPTGTTRSRVQSLLGSGARVLTQFGGASASGRAANGLAYCGFASPGGAMLAGGGNGGGTGSGGGAEDTTAPPVTVENAAAGVVPLLGAFLQNVAAAPHGSRAQTIQRVTRAAHRKGRQEEPKPGTSEPGKPVDPVDPPRPDDPTPPIFPTPTFYYDYYLGLWVAISDTPTTSTYTLFEDEGKTKPAGSIVTSQPADWTVYPQVYSSSYSFTAGYLAGSHGASENTNNAGGSGSSRYDNTYADGWTDSGASTWTGRGDYSWQSRSRSASGQTTESRGAFYANGSGGSHLSTSDGYTADYVYAADGSGHGTITGPDPGLPVTVSWDAYGNTTIRYADGSVETFSGYGYYGGGYGGGTPIPVDTPVATATANTAPDG